MVQHAPHLVSDGPKKAAAILFHVLDKKAFLPHLPLESPVLLSPLLFREVPAQVRVLILCKDNKVWT